MSFIKDLWTLHVENAKTKRALRMLSKQEWSVDFLVHLLLRAANLAHRPLEMTITNKDGMSVKINTIDYAQSIYKDDSIFNHLDDELKVRQFIESVNKR